MTLKLKGSPPSGQPQVSFVGSPEGKILGSNSPSMGSVAASTPSRSKIKGLTKSHIGYILSVVSSGTGGKSGPIRFSAPTAAVGVSPTDRAYTGRSLVEARMRVASAPLGSDLVVEVQHWGGSSWVGICTLTMAAGSLVEVREDCVQNQAVGDLVRLNVTSVGSTSPATGVVVDVLVS